MSTAHVVELVVLLRQDLSLVEENRHVVVERCCPRELNVNVASLSYDWVWLLWLLSGSCWEHFACFTPSLNVLGGYSE